MKVRVPEWCVKFLTWGLCGNYWIWFHILAGGIIAKTLLLLGLSSLWAVSIVGIVALIWEVIEFYFECEGDFKSVVITYCSIERWIYDCIGDILDAIFCAVIVVI